MQYVWFALIGAIAGALAGQFLSGRHKVLVDIVIGVLGALIGSQLFLTYLTSFAPAHVGSYVFAGIGALVFLAGSRALRSLD